MLYYRTNLHKIYFLFYFKNFIVNVCIILILSRTFIYSVRLEPDSIRKLVETVTTDVDSVEWH